MPESDRKTFMGEAMRKFSDTIKTVFENWNIETLSEDGYTSDKNESSVVLYGQLPNNYQVLLTADAGLKSLHKAYEYSISVGIDLKKK